MKIRLLPCAALLLTIAASPAQEFNLNLQSEGADRKLFSYYNPTFIQLGTQPPPAMKQAPDGLVAPLYGALKLGPVDRATTIQVIVDEPASGQVRLFLDSNGNGDFRDDPPAKWDSRSVKRRDGSPGISYNGSGTVGVQFGNSVRPLHFNFYRFDKDDPARTKQVNNLYYYRDYARTGAVDVAGKSYATALSDDKNRGHFAVPPGQKGLVTLHIDVNANGRFDHETERFDIAEPFNIGGRSYLAQVLDAEGSRIRIAPSATAAVERKSQTSGDTVQSFTAKTTTGRAVNFPADYKDKLVMLDFWATWCGPCLQELPNLTAAYEKFGPRNFEVLGVSLDSTKSAAEVQAFAAARGMTWPQICEGGGWETRLAKLFNVSGIPKAILVDGNTGKIVAEAGLRGTALAPALEKALADMRRAK